MMAPFACNHVLTDHPSPHSTPPLTCAAGTAVLQDLQEAAKEQQPEQAPQQEQEQARQQEWGRQLQQQQRQRQR